MSVRRFAFALLASLPLGLPAGSPLPASAQDSFLLTRQEARGLVLRSAPGALATRARGEAARGASHTDRVYPFNPTMEWKGVEVLDPGGRENYEAVFSQEIEWAGQWWVRRAAGAMAMDAASLEEEDALRLLLLDVDLAFFRLQAAQERERVARGGAELAQNLREAVGSQLREGQVSSLEMNLASIEAGRSQARALAARNELTRARQAFREVLGLDPDAAVAARSDPPRVGDGGPVGSLQPFFDLSATDTLVAQALAQRPDLLAARAREEEATSRRKLAAMEAIPNVNLGAVADRGGADADRTLGIRVSLPIPIWNRNQGKREQTRGEETLRQVERRDLELRVRGEVLTALEAFRTATEELDLFTDTVLEPARENHGLLSTAYQAGRLDLPTTLLLRSQLVDAELSYWDAWQRQREALAEMEAVAGGGP